MEKEIKDVKIVAYSNVSKQGVLLHLNKKATLKTGCLSSLEFWVSWDKIGEALIEGYEES